MANTNELAQVEALLRAIVEGTTDVVFVRDLQGRYLLANSAAASANDATVDELVGNDDSLLFPPEVVREIQDDDLRTVREGVTRTFERTLRPRGEAHTYHVTKGPCRDRAGAIFGVFVISRDITERKRIEGEQARLLESLARAQAIARIGNWERELATNEVYWSDEMCRLMGMARGESLDAFQDFLSLVHPDDRERVKTAVGEAIREGKPYSAEYRMLRRDGSILTIHATGKVEQDERGRPLRIVGTAQDITEQRQAENAVRAGEERVRLLLDASAEGIFGADLEGRCTFANHAFTEMLGYQRPEQLLGKSLHPIIHHTKLDGSPFPASECPALQAFVNNAAAEVNDDLFWRADGASVRVEYRMRPIVQDGKTTGLVTCVRDITERKRIEDERTQLIERELALREQADRACMAAEAAAGTLRTLEQITETALASLDLDDLLRTLVGRIQEAFAVDTVGVVLLDEEKHEFVLRAAAGLDSAMAHDFLRFPVDRGLAGRIVSERRPIVIDDLRATDLATPRLRDLGVHSLMGAPLRFADRTLGVIHVGSLVPRHFTADETTLLLLAADRIAVAIEHARLYDQARRANQARDEILGIVAHDLKNPVNVVALSAQLIAERIERSLERSEDVSRLAETILASARRMDRLVQDLLDVTRIEAGSLTLELARLAVEPLIAEAIELARPLASPKSLRLEMRLAPNLAAIQGDRHRLLQVLGNLIGNAVKFTDDGGTITVAAKQAGPDVQISVADTGTGIREEHLPHIFDRFWRATKSDRRSSGLGLSIADGLVRRHGGRIWVESRFGSGSTFFFTIPAEREQG
ncbi:MAG TPA: PAS domain S-box protein [Polyangiales bacterium]